MRPSLLIVLLVWLLYNLLAMVFVYRASNFYKQKESCKYLIGLLFFCVLMAILNSCKLYLLSRMFAR